QGALGGAAAGGGDPPGARRPLHQRALRLAGKLQSMDTTAWIELLTIVVALVVAAFAASAETSLTSISRVRLRHLCEEGNQRAIQIDSLHKDPNGYLSTILILNTVAII